MRNNNNVRKWQSKTLVAPWFHQTICRAAKAFLQKLWFYWIHRVPSKTLRALLSVLGILCFFTRHSFCVYASCFSLLVFFHLLQGNNACKIQRHKNYVVACVWI